MENRYFINPSAEDLKVQREKEQSLYHLKLQFTKFVEGSEVTEWLLDCEQYFSIYKIGESKKTTIAGMHLSGNAKNWFQVYCIGKKALYWQDFKLEFTSRFSTRKQELVHDDFKKLHQETTVESYFAQFEESREKIKERMSFLTEDYFVECFVGGFQGNIKILFTFGTCDCRTGLSTSKSLCGIKCETKGEPCREIWWR